MTQFIYQQTIQTTEELLHKWPNLGTVIPYEHVQTGLAFYQSRNMEDFPADEQIAAETLEFYNAVIADGRFVDLLATDPSQAAQRLGLTVRDQVFDLVRRSVAMNEDGGKVAISPGGVVVAVVIVIVFVARNPDSVVIDQSGIVKV